MKYSVMQCVNGNYSVVSEGLDESGAKMEFWRICRVLESSADVITGQVAIIGEDLRVLDNYSQHFMHEPTPEPEEPQGE